MSKNSNKNHWHSGWNNPPTTLSATQWDWLSHTASLTQRLKQRAPDVAFTLHHADWSPTLPEETALFDHRFASITRSWIREVTWSQGNTPWIWARTIVPENATYPAPHDWIALNAQPIGSAIFSDPSWRRDTLSFAALSKNHPYQQWIEKTLAFNATHCWARRSCLHAQGHVALVSEVFLPSFWSAQCRPSHTF